MVTCAGPKSLPSQQQELPFNFKIPHIWVLLSLGKTALGPTLKFLVDFERKAFLFAHVCQQTSWVLYKRSQPRSPSAASCNNKAFAFLELQRVGSAAGQPRKRARWRDSTHLSIFGSRNTMEKRGTGLQTVLFRCRWLNRSHYKQSPPRRCYTTSSTQTAACSLFPLSGRCTSG